jgi:hypothetical protein
MRFSITDALKIQENNVDIEVYYNLNKTGYGFIISLGVGENYKTLYSTLGFPYKKRRHAKVAGERLIKIIKETDFKSAIKAGLEKLSYLNIFNLDS